MARTVNPLLYPEQWDRIRIAGQLSPGICVVGETSRHSVWDTKRGKGAKGATSTYTGQDVAKFSVTFTLWRHPLVTASTDPDDFADWDDFVPLLGYDPEAAQPSTVDFFHPSIAQLDISAIAVEDIGNILHKGNSRYEVVIKFIEYNPPPAVNTTSTPVGAVSNPGGISQDVRVKAAPPPTAESLLASLQQQAMDPN